MAYKVRHDYRQHKGIKTTMEMIANGTFEALSSGVDVNSRIGNEDQRAYMQHDATVPGDFASTSRIAVEYNASSFFQTRARMSSYDYTIGVSNSIDVLPTSVTIGARLDPTHSATASLFIQRIANSVQSNVLMYNTVSGGVTFGAITVYTVNNGLEPSTSTNFQLGGALLHNTTIVTSPYYLKVQGSGLKNLWLSSSAVSGSALYVEGTGAAFGINVLTANGQGINVQSTNSSAIIGASFGSSETASFYNYSSGIGLIAGATDSLPFRAVKTPPTPGGVDTVIEVMRVASVTPIDGIGSSIDFYTDNTLSSGFLAHRLISKWTTVSTSVRKSQFSIQGVHDGITADLLMLQSTGQLRVNKYGVGSFVDTAVSMLGVKADGTLVEVGSIAPRIESSASGDITPDADTKDANIRTAQAAALAINAPTGTPVEFQALYFRIKDNGTARAITWNAVYRAIGVTLPTTTVLGKVLYAGIIFNNTDTKWDVVSICQEA